MQPPIATTIWIFCGLLGMALGQIPPKIYSKERGMFLLGFIYRNEQHESSSGPCDSSGGDLWCDPYFHICVKDNQRPGSCNLLDHTTDDFQNRDNVFFTDQKAFKIPLFGNVPKRLSVRIEATDYDRFTPNDHIATFENATVTVSPANVSTELQLKNTEVNMNNRRVMITGTLKLVCSQGWLGEYCNRLCFTGIHPTVVGCNPDGSFICQNGTRGKNCEKMDACFHPLCVPGAVCRNLDYGKYYECICNGHSGPECEASYNPCGLNPCQNGGVCTPLGADFRCSCPPRWKGKVCNTPLSPCEAAEQNITGALLRGNTSKVVPVTAKGMLSPVCNNRGVCEDRTNAYKCICVTGWTGVRCEERDTSNFLIIGVICAGILLIVLLALIPCMVRMRERRKKRPNPENGFIYQYPSPLTLATYAGPAGSPLFFNAPQFPAEFPAVGNINDYEYCSSTYNQTNSLSNEMQTFTPTRTLEEGNSASAAPAPPLPERPTTLRPLSPETTLLRGKKGPQDRFPLHSTTSCQPLLLSLSTEDELIALPQRSSTEVKHPINWFSSLRR